MRIGVGLPSTVPGASGDLVLEWATRAEQGPFSSLGVLDRLVYDSYDPLVTLAAAAATTERVALATMIVNAPLRNTALLAKELASLDALSRGRLVVGLGIGARWEDYEAAGVDHRGRGERFNQQLAELRESWETQVFGPSACRNDGPMLLVGGSTNATYARVARYADGYVHGGGPPRSFAQAAHRVRAAWMDAARPGEPKLWAEAYFALGDEETIEKGLAYMRNYYSFTGPFAERIAAGTLTSPQAIAQYIRGYEEAGCEELVLFPTVASLDQLDRLAEVIERIRAGHK
jgi:alkanesulfonate monooxygenase SsuD/methylene tetrahydromethanopterin reductase-like flavin-dependent oxidoreductase (luciferase family)